MACCAICRDRPDIDNLTIRSKHLHDHLRYVADINDKILIAGPLNFDNAVEYNGSLFIYAGDSIANARKLLEQDPYFVAGLYGEISFAPFTPARGSWI